MSNKSGIECERERRNGEERDGRRGIRTRQNERKDTIVFVQINTQEKVHLVEPFQVAGILLFCLLDYVANIKMSFAVHVQWDPKVLLLEGLAYLFGQVLFLSLQPFNVLFRQEGEFNLLYIYMVNICGWRMNRLMSSLFKWCTVK